MRDRTDMFQIAILAAVHALPASPHALDFAVMAEPPLVLRLRYASAEAYDARVSADVEALRALDGFACAESWSDSASPPATFLRYAPAPVVEAPRPIAPAPVPASPHRRR